METRWAHGKRKIELWSGYHQLRVRSEDVLKITFRTRYGQFEFLVIAFGLTNVHGVFMDFMNCVFLRLIHKCLYRWYLDLLAYQRKTSWTPRHNFAKLKRALVVCQARKVWLLDVRSLIFRAHNLAKGYSCGPCQSWSYVGVATPKNFSEVQSFLGLVDYYMRFIQNISQVAAPLIILTKKDVRFVCDENCKMAFSELKRQLLHLSW